MRTLLCSLLLACAGPTQQQLAETPVATTPATPSLAPPASDSDKERHQLNQQMETMEDSQQAHREAAGEAPPPPAQQPLPPAGGPPGEGQPVKKKGPAEQAPPRPKKK